RRCTARLAARPSRVRAARPDPARPLRSRDLDPEHVEGPDERSGSAPAEDRRRAALRGVVMDTPAAATSKTSRVGKRPIDLPKGVTATVNGKNIEVKGPKGSLARPITETVSIRADSGKLH